MDVISGGDYQPPSDDQLEEVFSRLFSKPRDTLPKNNIESIKNTPTLADGSASGQLAAHLRPGPGRPADPDTRERSPFQLQQNASPRFVSDLLIRLARESISYHDLANRLKIGVGTLKMTVLPFAKQMGLIELRHDKKDHVQLTGWAISLGESTHYMPILLGEAIHLCLALRWRTNPSMRGSWAYAATLHHLWDRAPLPLVPGLREHVAAIVRGAGAQAYDLPLDRVAFTAESVGAALQWLEALNPSVVSGHRRDRQLRRRTACPDVAVWWAIGELNRVDNWGGAPGTWVGLNDSRRALLARTLMLEPTVVAGVLSRAASASEALPGGACLRYDALRDAVDVVRTVPIGTYPGVTGQRDNS